MRPSCLFCASKHVAQAVVLMCEAKQGYPLHRWLAVGHLAEAGDELIADHPQLANTIRDTRLKLMDQSDEPFYSKELMDLLAEVRKTYERESGKTDRQFLNALMERDGN